MFKNIKRLADTQLKVSFQNKEPTWNADDQEISLRIRLQGHFCTWNIFLKILNCQMNGISFENNDFWNFVSFAVLKKGLQQSAFVINDNHVQIPRSKHTKKEHSKFSSKNIKSSSLGDSL